jgi:peptidyl-prolyl cis-trans isomerase C
MDRTVATVNGSPIDGKTLRAAMQSLAQEGYGATLDEIPQSGHAALRDMALERLVARELIFQAAMAEGFVADDAAVRDEADRILRMMGRPVNFWERLAERGMDETAFTRMVRKDVTVERLSARKLADVPEPGEAEIRQFYAEHPDKLREPVRVRASHILLPCDAAAPDRSLAQARALKASAEQGDFADVARRHSLCASAACGGDLGNLRLEDVEPAFAEAVLNQVVGTVGDPVRTSRGYHLIRVTARDLPVLPTLDEARGRITAFLKRARGAQLLQEWVAELRRSARIVMHDK